MDLGLKGKNAIVLGGTRGIGRAIAATLAGEASEGRGRSGVGATFSVVAGDSTVIARLDREIQYAETPVIMR